MINLKTYFAQWPILAAIILTLGIVSPITSFADDYCGADVWNIYYDDDDVFTLDHMFSITCTGSGDGYNYDPFDRQVDYSAGGGSDDGGGSGGSGGSGSSDGNDGEDLGFFDESEEDLPACKIQADVAANNYTGGSMSYRCEIKPGWTFRNPFPSWTRCGNTLRTITSASREWNSCIDDPTLDLKGALLCMQEKARAKWCVSDCSQYKATVGCE